MMYQTSNGLNIEVIIIRKKNKNIYFRVKDDLKIYVTCPMFLSKDSILKMISENESSILKMYEKAYLKSKDNELFIYLGKKYEINIDESIKEVTFIDNKVITPSIEVLDKFYSNKVKEVITNEVDIAKKCFLELPEFTLKYRNMKTRWGVCNVTKKTVTLNTELLKKDITLIDYVIIHELCHFFVANHSKEFWNLVSLAYPNYKEARKRLKE